MAWPTETERTPTDATTATFVNNTFSTKVINHVRANLVAVATTNTTWKAQLAKGNKVYIPVMSTYSASAVDPHTSLITTAISTNAGWGETAASHSRAR